METTNIQRTFGLGLVTSRDPSSLKDGELQQAVACEYRVGSPHLHKQPGRSLASTLTTPGGAVLGIHKFQYDTGGTDKLIAVAGGKIFEGDVSVAPTFGAPVVSGLSVSAVPHFSSFRDSWIMCNGSDSNHIREAGAVYVDSDVDGDNDWTLGNWRTLGMVRPDTAPVLATITVASSSQHVASATGSYTNNTNVTGDTNVDTYAYATVAAVTSITTTYSFAGGGAHETGSGRTIFVVHSGAASSRSFENIPSYKREMFDIPDEISTIGYQKIEVSEDNGVTWVILSLTSCGYSQTTSSRVISISTSLSTNVKVRVTTTATEHTGGWIQGRVHAIYVNKGATTAFSTTNDILYGFTERYEDSDGVRHESTLSPLATLSGPQTNIYGVTLTLPATNQNLFTTQRVIYRSLDATGEGYPNLYEIKTEPPNAVTVTDDFALSLTLAEDKEHIYDVLTVLYPDGSTFAIPMNGTPPKSKMAMGYQGSMVYVPVNGRRLFYSIPTTISAAGAEQVPEVYYLEFLSPTNDEIASIAKVNNGRVLLVFFESYTMMVTVLPQATDPGVFDTRIIEYVSTQRGAAGRFCTTELDMGGGRTIAVAVDALGVWATDGISELVEWSRDIDFASLMSGVTLSNIELVNNPEQRRLELLYVDGSGNRFELHLFYGRMKEDGDGRGAPIITGPHIAGSSTTGFRCKHYTTISGLWKGLSGSNNSTDGKIFLERGAASDASNAYDGSGNVPLQIKGGDWYFGGLGRAAIAVFGYPKFAGSTTKSVSFIGTFRRDGNTATTTSTKTVTANNQKKIYWSKYGDRHTLQITDISATDMPALVGYELEVRDAGMGRDT